MLSVHETDPLMAGCSSRTVIIAPMSAKEIARNTEFEQKANQPKWRKGGETFRESGREGKRTCEDATTVLH